MSEAENLIEIERECLESLRLAPNDPKSGLEKAFSCYYRAKRLANRRLMCLATNAVSNNYIRLKKVRESISWCKKSLEIANEIKDDYLRGRGHQTLATILSGQGHMPASFSEYRNALNYYRLSGSTRSQAIVLSHLGSGYARLAEYEEAILQQRNACDLLRRIGDEEFLAYIRITMARTYLESGRFHSDDHPMKAERNIRKIFGICERYLERDRKGVAPLAKYSALALVAEAHDFLLEREKAVRALEPAIDGFVGLNMPELTLVLRALLAKNLAHLGSHAKARSLIDEVLSMMVPATQNEDRRVISSCAVEVFRQCEDYKAALDAMERFHCLDSELRSTNAKVRSLQSEAHREIEQARMDAEMERLRSVELKAAHSELKKHAELLARFANYDGLTGLANRRFFDETLEHQFCEAIEKGRPLALILCDIDKFKLVNDNFSHQIGDEVLRAVSRILVEHCGAVYFPARYGGEELAVIMPKTFSDKGVAFADLLRESIQAFDWDTIAFGLHVTASFGVSTSRNQGVAGLLSDADELLYLSKRNGRNQVNGLRPPDLYLAA